ncbi:MAG: response regulator transcription factor [Bacteroidia bacterium]|nr:response regulator transcription factor [Bacteroidia bacterium]MCX7652802.1 response regulator transcription factor [Bacteroidia bacterium]MDW8417223.1 response regulator transcription factor [Bacteroidia bacterium]
MSSIPIHILVVDDHPLITQGIVGLFTGVSEVTVKATAHSISEALEVLKAQHADIHVALVDIRMQDGMGMELVRYMARHYPHIKAIALTMYDTEEYLKAMIQAGALGYVLKNTSREELIEAIKTVMEGHYYFSRATQDVIGQYILRQQEKTSPRARSTPATDSVHLTPREREILELIAQEMTNTQIAEKLGLSPRTVHTHRRSLMQKLGVKNSAGLVRYAIEVGIVSPRPQQ